MKSLLPVFAFLISISHIPVVIADTYSDGMQFYKNSEYEKAFSCFQKSTEQGNPEAQASPGS